MQNDRSPSGWRLILQKIVSQPRITGFLSHFVHYLDRFSFRLSAGRFSLSGFLAGWPVVNLTTTGARSGLPRTLPLIGIPDGEKIILIASNFGRAQHPGWYHNLKANPQATLYWRGQSGKYLAREATESERQHYWQMAERIYIGFPLYKQRAGERRIPIVVLSPEDPNDSAKGNP